MNVTRFCALIIFDFFSITFLAGIALSTVSLVAGVVRVIVSRVRLWMSRVLEEQQTLSVPYRASPFTSSRRSLWRIRALVMRLMQWIRNDSRRSRL
jgi:hypothetical protein